MACTCLVSVAEPCAHAHTEIYSMCMHVCTYAHVRTYFHTVVHTIYIPVAWIRTVCTPTFGVPYAVNQNVNQLSLFIQFLQTLHAQAEYVRSKILFQSFCQKEGYSQNLNSLIKDIVWLKLGRSSMTFDADLRMLNWKLSVTSKGWHFISQCLWHEGRKNWQISATEWLVSSRRPPFIFPLPSHFLPGLLSI